jgi:hypothetical protein
MMQISEKVCAVIFFHNFYEKAAQRFHFTDFLHRLVLKTKTLRCENTICFFPQAINKASK